MAQKSQKKKLKKLIEAVENCQISTPASTPASVEIVLDNVLDPNLLSKWPKPKMKVPTIFLHKAVDFAQHVRKLLDMGVNFYQPYLGTNYTRILCHSFNDNKKMLAHFNKHELFYHTYGHPSKRKMKVVIRSLPKDMDLDQLKVALKAANIPIVRVHKMRMKEFAKDKEVLALAVVPFSDEGKKLLTLKKVNGHDVKLEPPIPKTKQCFRCQKWGHSQRYCHGEVRCVKCAGDHNSKKCTRDREAEPPTCANCGGNHTASYRECFYCPDSTEYKQNQKNKMKRIIAAPQTERKLVTLENCQSLYKMVKNIPKHAEAKQF